MNNYDIKLKNDMILYLKSNNINESNNLIDNILYNIRFLQNSKINNYIIYLQFFIICMFHKRQFKNDKYNPNSKEIFYNSIIKFYDKYPNIIVMLISSDIISYYGYIKDYINIWEKICEIINTNLNYEIKSNTKYNYNDFNKFSYLFKKYNPLIMNISYILIKKKDIDYINLNSFLKQFNFMDHWSYNGINGLINLESNIRNKSLDIFLKTFNNNEYLHENNYSKLEISKIGMWLPREKKNGKYRNIYWCLDKNNNMEIMDIYDYLVLYDKIYNKNYNGFNININNTDRKRFRIELSIMNNILNTPQIFMCNNTRDYIDFTKCGSKFIFKNKKLLLNEKYGLSIENFTDNNQHKIKCSNNLKNFLKNSKNLKKKPILNLTLNELELNYSCINKIVNHINYKKIYDLFNCFII